MEELKLTQEQIDAMIAEKVAEAKKGLFTEEDLQKKVTSEVDRRVESGIQKGLETYKTKWEQEAQERAKMTAEEIAQKELKEKLEGLSAKEREIQKKENLISAKDMLSSANVPKSHYDKFIGMLVTDSPDTTTSNVQSFIDMFNATKSELETTLKSQMSNIKPPNTGDGDEVVTLDKFKKMGYAEKLKFKQTNPEMYAKFMK